MTSMAASLVDAEALRRQRSLNRLQSAVLLVGLLALAATTGFLFAGTDGVIIAAAIAASFLILNPVSGDALFRHVYGAIPLRPPLAPGLVATVAELAHRAELERAPPLFLIPTAVLQALAAGSREAPSIGVTSGLLQTMVDRRDPLAGRDRPSARGAVGERPPRAVAVAPPRISRRRRRGGADR
jgi:heat shock protein HtpX